MADLLAKENQNELYQPPFKVILLLVLEISSAFLMSFYFRQLITDSSGLKLILFLVGLVLFLVFSFFTSLLIKSFIWPSLGLLLATVASLVVFYDYFSQLFIVAALFIFLIFLWAARALRRAAEDSLKIRFFQLAKTFLVKADWGLILMLTLFCYFLLPANGLPLSFKNFQLLVNPSEKLVAIFIPGFQFEKSFQDNLSGLLEKQLAVQVPGFEKLPAATKTAALEQTFKDFPFDVQSPADQSIFDFLKNKFSQMDTSTQNWIIIGFFIILLLVVKFLFIFWQWILPPIIFMVYLFLSAINFVSIELESRDKEVVVL